MPPCSTLPVLAIAWKRRFEFQQAPVLAQNFLNFLQSLQPNSAIVSQPGHDCFPSHPSRSLLISYPIIWYYTNRVTATSSHRSPLKVPETPTMKNKNYVEQYWGQFSSGNYPFVKRDIIIMNGSSNVVRISHACMNTAEISYRSYRQ